MQKVIVTGVLGQDGSWMVDYLLENTDVEVYGVARRSANPNLENIKHVLDNDRFKIFIADLTDSFSLDLLVETVKPDYFINFAANSFVGVSWDMPEHVMDVNATGVIRCLEAIRKHAPHCRFYSAGSSEEFGDVIYSPQDELHPPRARSPYGASKVAARQLVKVYRESYNMYAIQGWLFNHESERRGEEFVTRKITKGVARIKNALDNQEPFEPLELGNLDASRDWSHAYDFCDGVWRMLNQELYNKHITESRPLAEQIKEYVLSSGETHSVKEFVEIAFEEAGIDGEWKGDHLDEKLVLKDGTPLVVIDPRFFRPAEVSTLRGNSFTTEHDLDWRPKISFRELVRRMVKHDEEEEKNKKR